MQAKQRVSAPQRSQLAARPPAADAVRDLPLPKTPEGAILTAHNHPESGECRLTSLPGFCAMQPNLTIETTDTESDVEQKLVYPLLNEKLGLGIPEQFIRTKPFNRAYDIGKGARKRVGFIPDYVIWANSLPTLIVEVKSPKISVADAYEEAQLYAHALNARFATGVNPASFVIGTNGLEILIGNWDAPAHLMYNIRELVTEIGIPEELFKFCGWQTLGEFSAQLLPKLRRSSLTRPYNLAGGQAILRRVVPINAFALGLANVLTRYFSSESLDNDEILTRGYVSSEDTTKYDAVLETFLRDSLQDRRDEWAVPLAPSHHEEPNLSQQLSNFNSRHAQGHLQLLIGGIGSGKSIFIRRYSRHLVPPQLRSRIKWVSINFNAAPENLALMENWVCDRFLDSFTEENPGFDIWDFENLERIFAPLLARRERSVYARLRTADPREFEIERSRDLRMWSDDHLLLVEHVCRYVSADCGGVVAVIFDNVDRLGKDEQLKIFSVAQWFKDNMRAFCILQMRDETYESYKDEKPLDTYRTAIRFYIRAPRFVDVIKKRVAVAEYYILNHLPPKISYQTEDGKTITYERIDLALFLRRLYQEIFQANRNSARIVESLAGRDTRRSLEMFTQIVTSGHLAPSRITSAVVGGGRSPAIREWDLLRILMRTKYRFFSDESGPLTNIFVTDTTWKRPTILLGLELLNYLIENRRTEGEIGLQGYFTVGHLRAVLENLGFDRDDVIRCCDIFLGDGLILADQLRIRHLNDDHSIKIHASGFMHARVLSERMEYLYGVLTVVPFRERKRAEKIANELLIEARSVIGYRRKVAAVRQLRDELREEIDTHIKTYSVFRDELRGSRLILERLDTAIERAATGKHESSRIEVL